MAKKNSSKTAHVLNLLTTQDEENTPETAGEPASQPDAGAAAKPKKKTPPKIEIQNSAEDPVSNLVRDRLERTLSEETHQNGTAGDTMLDQPNTNKAREINMSDQLTVNDLPANNQTEDYVTINIVEDIVKSRVKEFVQKLGGCDCFRCVNDVVALALNELPPKYTVTHKGMLFAKITSYENQYSADISAALTKACMMVNSSPRH